MRKINEWLKKSSYIEPLSPACEMCARGSKLVVLITGLCPSSCFYCPLSENKQGRDLIFADEWKLNDEKDVDKLFKEAEYIEAEGAGITGGDPLVVWKRTSNFIKILKKRYSSDFNIHLYTSGLKNHEHIDDLVTAGLDEIRFHPSPDVWKKINDTRIGDIIKETSKKDLDVAIEIPVVPNYEQDIISLVKWADENSLKWVNLNELEFSETNALKLMKRGFNVKDDISSAVLGSETTAKKVIKKLSEENLDIGVHYCSSSFKDAIQLKNRIKRRAKNIANDFDIITDEGTIIKGIIYPNNYFSLKNIEEILQKEFRLNKKYYIVKPKRIEVKPEILEKISTELSKKKIKCYLVEEYPTADKLEVERTPLPI